MRFHGTLFIVTLVACGVYCLAIPKKSEEPEAEKHKKSSDRVHDQPLSDEDHFANGDEEHNPDYDHEAFLGKDEAKSFDQLTPDESKVKLGLIYDKIDKDKDGEVTEEELRDWIRYVQNKYIMTDTERQWKEHTVVDGQISWDAYRSRTYGFINTDKDKDEEGGDYSYKDMMRRDERRWQTADRDSDGKLSKEEFADFLHPEERPHMRDVVINETLEDIDKDGDGYISLEEYIGDMWPNNDGDEKEEGEPDWVRNERDQFRRHRDKNGDGRMDRAEVSDWIIPVDYDHSSAEARHLILESDADRDGALSKDEVLEKYELFVGSQATDFGEALTRHDEF